MKHVRLSWLTSITTRLLLVNAVICLAFLALIAVVFFSFQTVRTVLTTIVTEQTQQLFNNARFGRTLAQVLADTNFLVSTFYGEEDYLQQEGERLLEESERLLQENENSLVYTPLKNFSQTLHDVLASCETVNAARQQIETRHQEFNEHLSAMETTISERVINLIIEGQDAANMERLSNMVPGFREAELQVYLRFFELGLEYFKTSFEQEDHPLLTRLDELYGSLYLITATDPEIAKHGAQLLDDVRHYQQTVEQFHHVAQSFGEQLDGLQTNQQHVLSLIGENDAVVLRATQEATGELEAHITQTMRLNLAVLLFILSIVLLGGKIAWSIKRPLRQAIEYIARFARGDIPDAITVNYSGEFAEMKKNVNVLISTLKQVVLRIQRIADLVANGSYNLRDMAEGMTQSATMQASAMEEVSASIEQMAANIRQNTENALHTEQLASTSAENAQLSEKAVNETITAMQTIASKVSIIEEMSSQTRLLSLNATIEAARAGDFGKGFAVVASEVRGLAERSQDAANEITQLMSSSLKVAEKSGNMLKTLVPDIQQTANFVQKISAASREQDSGAEQINSAIQQLDQVTQQNTLITQELFSTAEKLADQARQLQNAVAFFTTSQEEDQAVAESPQQTPSQPEEKAMPSAPPPQKAEHAVTTSLSQPEKFPHIQGDDRDAEFERYSL